LMVSTCVQGVIFCIIAAQPILIIGFSGPLLLFEEAFFAIFRTHPLILNYEHVNDTLDNPFHPVIKKHIEIHPDGNVTVQDLEVERPYPNTALLSMCLMFGCFFIAYFLRQFKNGTFLPGPIRRLIGDFGVPIAIFFMIAVDISIEDAYTQVCYV
ncbi:hypothetical protein GOODEAATRI_013563, partial [Goodea atripinnis]